MTTIFESSTEAAFDGEKAEHMELIVKEIAGLLDRISTVKPESVHAIVFSVLLKPGYESPEGDNGTTTMLGLPEDLTVLVLKALDRLLTADLNKVPGPDGKPLGKND